MKYRITRHDPAPFEHSEHPARAVSLEGNVSERDRSRSSGFRSKFHFLPWPRIRDLTGDVRIRPVIGGHKLLTMRWSTLN
jgi:hypothetical protein